MPGTTLFWSFAHRARVATETAVLHAGPPPGFAGGPTTVLATASAVPPNGWQTYEGTFVVPARQVRTRLQFTPLQCGENNPTLGNVRALPGRSALAALRLDDPRCCAVA